MKIYFYLEGLLKAYYKQESGIVELEEGSTLEDFCININELMGEEAKRSIWNSHKKRFRGPIAVSVDGEVVKDLNYKLQNEQKIKLVYYIVGG
jgi:sulfur carrier protein ThiS